MYIALESKLCFISSLLYSYACFQLWGGLRKTGQIDCLFNGTNTLLIWATELSHGSHNCFALFLSLLFTTQEKEGHVMFFQMMLILKIRYLISWAPAVEIPLAGKLN